MTLRTRSGASARSERVLQLPVRVMEESYLRALHGEAYAVYEASTGRFLPGIARDRHKAVRAGGFAVGDVATRQSGAR